MKARAAGKQLGDFENMASTDDTVRVPRKPQAVAKRILALFAIVEKAHNQDLVKLQRWVSKHKIHDYFSRQETAFYSNDAPSQQDIVEQSWRAESLVPLFWAVGMIDELPPLNSQVSLHDIKGLQAILERPTDFIQNATTRPQETLEEAEQHLYDQHWRVRDAQIHGKPMPEELDPGIVFERRYGASWLVGWSDDWDNVPMDT